MEPFIGQIIMFGGNFAPRGWALCDGQLLQIASNSALFSILGTTYGGDGRVTFGLPDLRGRVSVHQGNGPGLPPVTLGEKAGNATTTLNTQNLPPHTHSTNVTNSLRIAVSSDSGDSDNPEATILAGGADIYAESAPDAEMNAAAIAGTIDVVNLQTGNGTPFSNMPPFLGINYIIALVGTFPSRS